MTDQWVCQTKGPCSPVLLCKKWLCCCVSSVSPPHHLYQPSLTAHQGPPASPGCVSCRHISRLAQVRVSELTCFTGSVNLTCLACCSQSRMTPQGVCGALGRSTSMVWKRLSCRAMRGTRAGSHMSVGDRLMQCSHCSMRPFANRARTCFARGSEKGDGRIERV